MDAASISAGAVGATALANNAVTGPAIAAGAVGTSQLADTSVTGAKIAAATITGAKIAPGSVTGGATGNLAAGTVTAANIAAGTVTGGTGGNLAATTITGANIAAATITGAKIASATITGSNIAAGSVPGSAIDSTTSITAANFAFTAPKTSFWSVPGRAFISDTGNGYASCFPDTLGGTANAVFHAPVNLPHGATVTSLTYGYWKGADNSTLVLNRNNIPVVNSPSAMASLTGTSVGHTQISTTVITNPVIDNQNFVYYLVVTLGPTSGQSCIDTVSIVYTYVNP